MRFASVKDCFPLIHTVSMDIFYLMLALLAALAGGSLNLILSWLMQQLIDAASGVPGTLGLGTLARLSCGFLALYVAMSLLKYAS